MHTEVYKRADDRWAWRVVAENGNIIATDGGQGYENKADCERMAARFTLTPDTAGSFEDRSLALLESMDVPSLSVLQGSLTLEPFGTEFLLKWTGVLSVTPTEAAHLIRG